MVFPLSVRVTLFPSPATFLNPLLGLLNLYLSKTFLKNFVRKLCSTGSETLQDTIEAIVEPDNDNLLQNFIGSDGDNIANDGHIRKLLVLG